MAIPTSILISIVVITSTILICNCSFSPDKPYTDLKNKMQPLMQVMSMAEQQSSWPTGFCHVLYTAIIQHTKQIYPLAYQKGLNLIALDMYQLMQQSAAMLPLCPDIETNRYPGGQLQHRYLRADMSLWKAQFTMQLSALHPATDKMVINTLESFDPVQFSDTQWLQSFRDCIASYCPEVVVIPPGSYQMGGTAEEHQALHVDDYRAAWESPRHSVTINQSFALATTQITVGEFAQFIRETGHRIAQGCLAFPGQPAMSSPDYRIYQADLSWQNPGFPQTKKHPVTCISRSDAEAYARWLSIKTGYVYRLPSEAEWEYAARAGTTTPYFWGDKIEDGCQYAAIYDHSTDKATRFGFITADCNDHTPYTAKVASFKPNAWGLYDMTGNVREWVSDAWQNSYLSGPFNEKVRLSGVMQFPVLRGGAWNYMPQNQRIAYRSAYYSFYMRSNMWGFRLAREL